MNKTVLSNLQNRRSHYHLGRKQILTDDQLIELLQQATLHTPSAFNSQTTRVVVLLGEQHEKMWNITKEVLRGVVPPEHFPATEQRIQGFSNAYGTILFFEDLQQLQNMEAAAPYADKFSDWSNHTNGMHQINIWNLLEEAGYGASLQHYNSLIDNDVKAAWNIPHHWTLLAQMPFGSKEGTPMAKEFQPIDQRLFVYR